MAKTKTPKAMKTGDAMKWAQKKYGTTAMVKHDPKALTEAEKEPLREQAKQLRDQIQQARTEKRPVEEIRVLLKQQNELAHLSLNYPYSVGHTGLGGMFFHVKGQGDTWEQAIKQAEERGY